MIVYLLQLLLLGKWSVVMETLERFEAKFERVTESGCWIWKGAIFPERGYGAFAYPGEQLAHRVSWRLYRGEIPEGKFVLHRCDVPACVNPEHLFLGTQTENMADKVRKARQSRGAGTGVSKLTQEQVVAIKADARLQKEIALSYGISQSAVSEIKLGKTWKHVEGLDVRYQRKGVDFSA